MHRGFCAPEATFLIFAMSTNIFYQIITMSFITLIFACLGFLSPANRGGLGTAVVVLFVCLGVVAGYVSARLYKSKFFGLW